MLRRNVTPLLSDADTCAKGAERTTPRREGLFNKDERPGGEAEVHAHARILKQGASERAALYLSFSLHCRKGVCEIT